jgi:hypothetical protein
MLKNKHGRQMMSYEILPLFGLPPSGAIPADMAAITEIDGVMVRIMPRGTAHIKRRVLAECPFCKRWVCAGHLDQHYKAHGVHGWVFSQEMKAKRG